MAGLAIWLSLAPGPALAEVTLYRPSHRLADELRPLAATMLGSEGRVAVDPGTGALVLRGERDAVQQTLALLRRLDVPLRSFRVESLARSESELRDAGLAVSGWIDLGGVRVGRLPGEPQGLQLRAGMRQERGGSRFAGSVAVREGASADLWCGRDVPAAVAVLGDGERVLEARALRPLRSGFRVRPRGLADGTVELWIRPILEQDSLDSPVLEAGAETRISVEPGEWLVLGEIEQAEDGARRQLGAASHHAGRRETVLLVRVSDASGGSGQ